MTSYKKERDTKNIRESEIENYVRLMMNFAMCLINNPTNANIAFKKLKEKSIEEYNSTERFNYSYLQDYKAGEEGEYGVVVPELQEFVETIKEAKYDCARTLSIFKRHDPELVFYLPNLEDLETVSREFGYKNKENIINFWIYYSTLSQMRYVNLLKDIYPLE